MVEPIRNSKKKETLEKLFRFCQEKGDFNFDNADCKRICLETGFGNPFDVTKIDRLEILPSILQAHNYTIVHLGNGKHKFVQALNIVFHTFEPINQIIEWP